jgi:hypothetical protein
MFVCLIDDEWLDYLVAVDETAYYEVSLQLSNFLAPDFLANHPTTIPIPSFSADTGASATSYWQYVGWESNER